MKKLKILLCLTSFLICNGLVFGQTQIRKWFVAPNIYDFTVPAVSTGFTSANAYNKEYNSICDNNGNLVFYIANGVIYNKFNNVIGALATMFSHTEVAIVPNPANYSNPCSEKYYIIYPQSAALSSLMAYGEVDMNGNSGAGSYTYISTIPASIGGGGANPMAISKLNSSGNRFLYFVGSGVNYLPICSITSSGINYLGASNPAYSSLISADIEMELSNAGDKLAFSRQAGINYELIIVPLNPLTGLPSASPVIYNTGQGLIHGIEFDNSGTKIFFTKDNASGGIFWQNTLSTTYSPNFVTGSLSFKSGMLEKNYLGNDVICASSSQIGRVDVATNTILGPLLNSVLPVIGTGYGNPTYIMPDQIDGENYDSGISMLFPVIATNTSICFNDQIILDGSASYGTLNGNIIPNIITSHVWTIEECDAVGNVIGTAWWSPWTSGIPGIYTVPNASSGGPNIQCGKYYKVKLAVQNCDVTWAETSKIVFIKCLPYTNAGPDVTICNGNCVTIGTVKPRGANYSYSWYYGTNEFASTAQVTVCPTSTTTYYVTVTDNINGCSNTDAVTVTVENNNPGFSLTANTTNPTYMSLSANPNQTTGMPVGFGHMWFIDELDASLNPVYSVNSSNSSLGSCWWTFPGAEVFDGFDGLTYTLNSACLPNPGKFKYNTYYRITRGVWSTNCLWSQAAFLIMYTKSNNGVVIVEDNNAPNMSAYAGIATDAFDVIPQMTKVNEINIYPNPAENVLYTTYNINEGSASIIQLTDMTGRVFKTCQLQNSNGKVELNISEYQNGVYCVNLVTNGNVISSRKLIISK